MYIWLRGYDQYALRNAPFGCRAVTVKVALTFEGEYVVGLGGRLIVEARGDLRGRGGDDFGIG